MSEWTRDKVEERITEAAAVLKRLPGPRAQGYFSTWPEIQRTAKEISEGMPKPMRLPPPSWPTPLAGDAKGTRNRTSGRTSATGHHDGLTLCDATRLWATPDTPGGGRSMPPGTSITGRKPDGRKVTVGLANQARLWMTPTARDHKDGATSLANTPVNGLLGRQVLAMPPAGSNASHSHRSLSPLFVEALMGWPSGWTGFGSVATAWSRWLRRMRCELLLLSLPVNEGAAG